MPENTPRPGQPLVGYEIQKGGHEGNAELHNLKWAYTLLIKDKNAAVVEHASDTEAGRVSELRKAIRDLVKERDTPGLNKKDVDSELNLKRSKLIKLEDEILGRYAGGDKNFLIQFKLKLGELKTKIIEAENKYRPGSMQIAGPTAHTRT